ncbi:hypothetical protein C9Y88_24335, partial [Escherichia coli]|uniref:hypothetical protein n=1 Tax=Escherichia coli TaxID=562 RepID=UPI0010AC5C7B
KRVFLVILFTSFSGSLVSRISGAVQYQHGSVTPDTFQYAKGMITREIAAAFMLMLKHGAHRK